MRAITTRTDRSVVLPNDDDEIKTLWTIRALTNGENAYIRDRVTELGDANAEQSKVGLKIGTTQYLMVAIGLVGVTDFYDVEGVEVKLETRKEGRFTLCTNAFLDKIPQKAFDYLANAISLLSETTPEHQADLELFRPVDNG